jgi:hypothetical protein
VHQFRIMSKSGDDKHQWNPSDDGSVAVAERIFEDHVTKRGGAAFATYAVTDAPVREGPGSPSDVREAQTERRIDRFDPQAEEIVIVPRMQGGC